MPVSMRLSSQRKRMLASRRLSIEKNLRKNTRRQEKAARASKLCYKWKNTKRGKNGMETLLTTALEREIEAAQGETISLLKALCAIPAPSHHEERRAEWIQAWLEKRGLSAEIDDAEKRSMWFRLISISGYRRHHGAHRYGIPRSSAHADARGGWKTVLSGRWR